MKRFRFLFSLMVPALVMILAACGNTYTTSGNGNSTATANPTSTPGTTIKTTSVTVGGKNVTLLTNDKGWTLYYFTPDTATTSNCTGACAKTWPPLIAKETPAST